MRRPRAAALLLVAACGEVSPPPAGDAGPRTIDPGTYDCRATAPPERASTTPIACIRDPSCRTRMVAGHRGAGGALGKLAPEDSLSAYRAAIAYGLDFAETDPRITGDGVLINLHDPEVDRTTTGTGAADQLTLAEIQALPLEESTFAGDFSCERVPRFEDVLSTCRGRIHVLVDANKTDRVELLVEAIQRTDTLEWAIFDTSSVEKIDRALALEPRLLTMIRVADAAEMRAQLTHFAAHPPIIVEVDRLAGTATTAHALGHRVFLDVFVSDFAVNLDGDSTRYLELYEKGADILQSDRPEAVLQALGRR